MEVIIRYDFIRAPFAPGTSALLGAAMDQVEWADKKGFASVQVGEHHGTDSDYNSSPITVATAFAARTKHMRINPILLLPLYDPVRLGEDLCLIDQISGGRLTATMVLGYVPSEFEMFGVDLKDRGRLADRNLGILKQIFAGEPFDFEGRRGRVTPGPVQPGGPPLIIGGSLKASAQRAARFGDGMFPMSLAPELLAEYERACAALGKPTGRIMRGEVAQKTIFVTDDPDRAWAQIRPYVAYFHNFYAGLGVSQDNGFPTIEDVEELKAQRYLVLTPDEAIALCRQETALGHYIVLLPLLGGLPPELSWPSLELFADKVMPAVLG